MAEYTDGNAAYVSFDRGNELRTAILASKKIEDSLRPAHRVDWAKIIHDDYVQWIASMQPRPRSTAAADVRGSILDMGEGELGLPLNRPRRSRRSAPRPR